MAGRHGNAGRSFLTGVQRRGLVTSTAWAVAGALIFGLVAAPGSPVAKADSGSAGSAKAARVAEKDSAAEAFAAARAQGSDVEILAERTGKSTTWATASGDRKTEFSAAPIRVKRNGKWVPINIDLVGSKAKVRENKNLKSRFTHGKVLRPKATAYPVRISAGGEASAETPLAEASTTTGKSIALYWPEDLPKPEISGPEASYEISPTEDLRVTAMDAGFAANVILAQRPKKTPVYRFPVELAGATLTKGEAGGYAALDSKGNLVFSIAPPVIWDSSPLNDPDNPDAGPIQTPLDSDLVTDEQGRSVLELRPSADYLARATFPVTVDPTVNVDLTGTMDTFVKEGAPTSSFGSDAGFRVGYTANALRQRAYIFFQVPFINQAHVLSAGLKLRQWDALSCTATAMNAYPITSGWTTGMTWNSGQPSITTSSAYSGTKSFAHGYEAGGCANAYDTVDVTKMVSAFITGNLTNQGIALRAASETGANTYKGFCSLNYDVNNSSCGSADRRPTLTVTYNHLPLPPIDQAAEPKAQCDAGSARPFVNTTIPILTGSSVDDDNDSTRLNLEVWNLAGTTSVATGNSGSFLPPGSINEWMVPPGKLADGTSYKWRAKGDDGTDVSSLYSLWCEFTVDVTKPNPGSVSSTDYPAGAWSQTAGTAGTFTLTPGTDPAGSGGAASGVTGVAWSVDDDTPDTVIATTGSAVAVTAKPDTDGKHTLYVSTLDKAGNASTPAAHVFYVGKGAVTSPEPGDRTARRFTLTSAVKDATAVTFQYKRGDTAWADVPGGTAAVVGGVTAPITWDASATVGGDGAVDLRVLLTGGTGDGTGSTPISVTVDRLASDAATAKTGPGTLNLLTGDYTLDVTDTSYFGISVSRTARSRDPQSGDHVTGQAGPFGPQWAAGGVAETASTDFVSLTQTAPTAIELTRTDSTRVQFTTSGVGSGASTQWDPEVGAEEMSMTGDAASGFTLTDTDGTVTTFAPDAVTTGLFTIASTTPPGVANATRYTYNPTGTGTVRLSRIIAPTQAVNLNSCTGTGTPAVGCRVLELSYATTTTATSSAFADFAGRASSVTLWVTTPGTSTVTGTVVSRYAYDEAGRLREQWDPRISPALKATYSYDNAGRVTEVGPPGDKSWTLTYGTAGDPGDSNTGRLLSVTRDALDDGKSTTVWNVVYGIPLTTGNGGPYDMNAAGVAAWNQSDLPTDATAVYPPDQAPSSAPTGAQSSYTRSTIHYLDVEGREVNTAIPGGGISTTEFDDFGNTVRELSINNRARALRASTDPELVSLGLAEKPTAERADLLSSTSLYDDAGKRLLQTFGPLHQVELPGLLTLPDGTMTAPDGGVGLAREHGVTTYDEGRPTDGSAVVQDMPTTSVTGARLLVAAVDVDTRTTRTYYDWTIGKATKTVADSGGLNISTQTAYDNRARPTRTDMPTAVEASRTTGADSTSTEYYTATGSAPCGGRPEWDGMVCRVSPAGAITGGGSNPTQRVTTTTTYTDLGQVAAITETANGTTRTKTTTYDGAGRVDTVTTTGGIGTAVPVMKTVYDTGTGRVVEMRDTSLSPNTVISQSYDLLGRETAYTDADGGRTETTYTYLDQIKTRRQFSNGATPLVTTYAYSSDRQLLTAMVDPVAGTFTAAYDPAGQVITQSMPGTVTMAQAEDPTGAWLDRTYTGPAGALLTETLLENVHGQTRTRVRADNGTKSTNQVYVYDQIGRLTRAGDTTGEVCIARTYGFDPNSNRTSLNTATGSAGSGCPTSGGTTVTSTYDTADRITNSGYVYDNHGRSTTAPLPAGSATLAYFTTDLVQRQTVGSSRQTWVLDPAMRFRGWTTEANNAGTWTLTGTKTNHYAGGSDAPAWITENTAGAITRNVPSITGDLAATSTATSSIKLLLTTLHGDAGQTLALTNPTTIDSATAPSISDTDEYGRPKAGTTAGRYNWLGAKERSGETVTGSLILMGVRLYNPSTGRFLTTDPVAGGNANSYDYCTADPINCVDIDGAWGISTKWYKRIGVGLGIAGFGACVAFSFGVCAGVTVAGAIIGARGSGSWGSRAYFRQLGVNAFWGGLGLGGGYGIGYAYRSYTYGARYGLVGSSRYGYYWHNAQLGFVTGVVPGHWYR